jgi:hypothetical protein
MCLGSIHVSFETTFFTLGILERHFGPLGAFGEKSSRGRHGCLEICVASLARVPSAGLAGVRPAERAL